MIKTKSLESPKNKIKTFKGIKSTGSEQKGDGLTVYVIGSFKLQINAKNIYELEI